MGQLGYKKVLHTLLSEGQLRELRNTFYFHQNTQWCTLDRTDRCQTPQIWLDCTRRPHKSRTGHSKDWMVVLEAVFDSWSRLWCKFQQGLWLRIWIETNLRLSWHKHRCRRHLQRNNFLHHKQWRSFRLSASQSFVYKWPLQHRGWFRGTTSFRSRGKTCDRLSWSSTNIPFSF